MTSLGAQWGLRTVCVVCVCISACELCVHCVCLPVSVCVCKLHRQSRCISRHVCVCLCAFTYTMVCVYVILSECDPSERGSSSIFSKTLCQLYICISSGGGWGVEGGGWCGLPLSDMCFSEQIFNCLLCCLLYYSHKAESFLTAWLFTIEHEYLLQQICFDLIHFNCVCVFMCMCASAAKDNQSKKPVLALVKNTNTVSPRAITKRTTENLSCQ